MRHRESARVNDNRHADRDERSTDRFNGLARY